MQTMHNFFRIKCLQNRISSTLKRNSTVNVIIKKLTFKPLLPVSNLRHFGFVKSSSVVISGTFLLNYITNMSVPIKAEAKSFKHLVEEADSLYENQKFEEIYELLIAEKESKNDEILWRLARSAYEKARKTDKNEAKKALFAEALHYLEEANRINSNNFAVHKWMSIIMDCFYTLEGMKSRISHLYDMKAHMEKACELKPMDGTSWYVLGMWYFGIANISWYERKAAALFFATPPASSYEEALKMFLEAERVEPDFYSKNYLMIGKCLYNMGKKDEAKEYFIKAQNYPKKTMDDEEANVEAEKWLKGM